MTPNLARYIQIARHHIYGTPVDKENQIEQQRVSAIEDFQVYIFQKMDISVRMELLVPSNWHWDDAIGASVQFSVDGHNFFLALQGGGCRLFWSWRETRLRLQSCRIRTGSSLRIICWLRSVMLWNPRLCHEPEQEVVTPPLPMGRSDYFIVECLQGNAHLEPLCDRLDNLHYSMSGIDLLTQTQQPEALELVHIPRYRPSIPAQFLGECRNA